MAICYSKETRGQVNAVIHYALVLLSHNSINKQLLLIKTVFQACTYRFTELIAFMQFTLRITLYLIFLRVTVGPGSH